MAVAADTSCALPEEAPLAMPAQSLDRPPRPARRPLSAPRRMALRRLLVIGGAILLTLAGGEEMYWVLNGSGASVLGLFILVLFVVLFAWIALAFTSTLAGFFCMLRRGGGRLGIHDPAPLPALIGRTALLMPIYNEDPARVMAGLQATAESLAATGRGTHFDCFLLSDTTDPDAWIAEEAAFLALRERLDGPPRIFYRRRAPNTGRKAGNIAEWVRRFGGAYRQFLILDADSVMQGEAVVRLALAMQRHEDVGLIQTLPTIVNGRTLFARLQQFAGHVYGPLIAHGIAWWHGSEGNYWGHNAMIRTQAFAEQAGLPRLPGKPPFGGDILSHDFVEAALLRRGGWAVHMIPDLPGSYEEGPPGLTDVAIRDRRWCQGNLQHGAVLPARGLHWVSRLHLLMGIGSYITAPLWLVFLLSGLLIALQSRFVPPEYFGDTKSLFPRWPQVDPVLAKWMFIGTMAVLLLPKLLAWIALSCDTASRRGCGGVLRALLGVLIETGLGGLLAPVTMLIQTGTVFSVLTGGDSGWNAQRRGDSGLSFGQIWRDYRRFMGLGLCLAVAAYAVSLPLFLWMTPVLLGLSLAVPLAALTASRRAGGALRRMGLLQVAEERAPPPVLARADALYAKLRNTPAQDGMQRLVRDPILRRYHCAQLPPPRRPGLDPIDVPLLVGLTKLREAASLEQAGAALSRQEKAAVLASDEGIERLMALGGASVPPARP